MRSWVLIGAALASLGFAAASQAAVLTSYDFSDVGYFGTSTTAIPAAGVTGGNLQMHGMGSVSMSPGALLTQDYIGSGTPDYTCYFDWSISPQAGKKMSLTSIGVTFYNDGSGASRFQVVSGLGTTLTTKTNVNSQSSYSITLSGAEFTDLTTPVTFRLYPYYSIGGTYGLSSSLTVNGTVVAAPEPAILGLSALLIPLMARRRKHETTAA